MMECSIGIFKREECHKKNVYTRSSWLKSADDISEIDKVLLVKRTGIRAVDNICEYHYHRYIIKFYTLFGIKCCDPLRRHKKNITKSLREITLSFSQEYEHMNLIPGFAICTRCYDYI